MPLVNDKPLLPALSKGAEVDLAIEKLAFGGKALGRVDGFVVFVDHAVPGQTVRVRITRKKSQFAEARGGAAPGAVPGVYAALLPPFWRLRRLPMAGSRL